MRSRDDIHRARIAHVVSSLRGGGMEHFVLRLAEAQRERGHDVAIVALAGGPLLEQARAKGLVVHVLDGSDSDAPARAGKFGRILRAIAILTRLSPDLVHAHNPTSMHYAVIGKVVAGARLVVTDHAQTRGIVRVPTPLEWRLVDAVVAVSQKTADDSSAIGAPKGVRVIPNGIEPRKPKRTRAEFRAALELGDAPVVLHVAGFVHVKAHDVLIEALAEVHHRGVPLQALLVGDGETRTAMEALAKDRGLDNSRVRFLGFRDDVPDLLGAADLFALPSRAEGLPLAVLEAMAAGLPVVATPVGGVPELVTDGEHGLLVPVDDHASLAKALERLANDAALRDKLGRAGAARAIGEFSFEAMVDRYEDLYGSIL